MQVLFNVQLHTKCAVLKNGAVLIETLCNSKICYLVAQGYKKVNSSKIGRFRYKMIGETKEEMELLER